MSDVSFGQEIRRRRELLRLSQSDLARRARVSRNTIGNVERGNGQTEERVMQALTNALSALEYGEGAARVEPATQKPGGGTRSDAALESIARTLDALATALSDDLISTDSTSPEAMAIRATRRAYQHAAQIVRGEMS